MNYRIEPDVFIKGDCVEVLKKNKFNAQLIITDPPYNIGWKYSKETNDRKHNYHEWCLEWAELCFKNLSNNGVFCVINYPENNNVLYTDLIRRGYNFIQQLVWNYSTNIGQSKRKYTRSHRTILIFSKSKNYFFNGLRGEYKNPSDQRIKKRMADGFAPMHYDVFTYQLCKNVSKEKKKVGINQLPRELAEMLIKTFSDYHDVVLDPFAGNRTITDTAWELCRGRIAIDLNDYEEAQR